MKYLNFFMFAAVCLNAQPKNHSVVSGDAKVSQDGNLMEINVSDRAILNWEEFSIQLGETTRFIQPSTSSAVLNRVTGAQMSEILGSLQSGGHVYLINPNGVVIGPEGRIDTAGFVSSIYEIQNIDFLNGEPLKFQGDELGEIINLGTITTTSGPVALIAHRVENSGTIRSAEGIVSLNSGHEILLDPTGLGLLFIRPDLKGDGVVNNGTIEAYKTQLQADGTPTSLAISLGGIIDAGSVQNIDGEVYLIAKEGSIDVSGKILCGEESQIVLHAENGTLEMKGNIVAPSGDIRLLGKNIHLLEDAIIEASEGTVLIGGDYKGRNPEVPKADYVYCSHNSRVNVDGRENGDGGKVIFWGEKGMIFYGNASSRGGTESGNGGFVEVSSPGAYVFKGLVCTLAPHGKAGKLLLDPTDITVDTNATSASLLPPSMVGMNYTYSEQMAMNTASLNNLDLQLLLGMGNVEIDATSGGGAGNGDITIDAPFNWDSFDLSLRSSRNVIFTSNAVHTISGVGSLSTTAVPLNFTMQPGSNINYLSVVSPLTLTANNLLTIDGTITLDTSSFSSTAVAFNDVGGSINCTGGGSITLSSATSDVFVTGTLTTVGAGTINLIPAGPAGQLHLQNGCTLNSVAALNLNPASFLNMSGTVTMITPSTITLTSVNQTPLIRGGNATLNASCSSLSFPKGVNLGGAGLGLTVNATTSDVFIGSNVNLAFLEVNSTGNLQIQGGTINITTNALTLNAGGDLILDTNSIVRIVAPSTSTLTLQSPSNSIQIGDNVTVQGTGPVIVLAGNDINVSGSTGTIRTMNADDLNLVVDNNNPNPFDIGTGKFTFPSGFVLSTASPAKVLLFATTPTINPRSSFPTTINGVVGDDTNILSPYWYLTLPPPDPSFFQIMYKSGSTVVPPVAPAAVVQTIQIAVTEPVSNPPQITQITEGNLQPPATPNPKSACRSPPVAIQAL
jgi:filamentous hemagglutinin family protein